MEILNHDFIKDKQRVYRKGVLLRGITPEGFHVYNGIFVGNHQVIYTPYGDAKIAHPASFEALDDGISCGKQFPYSYGKDEEFVYFFTGSTDTKHAVRLKACHNPQTFSVLSEKFAKDDKHVYREEQILKKANPATFEVLKDYYARDDKEIESRRSFISKSNDAVTLTGGSRHEVHSRSTQAVEMSTISATFCLDSRRFFLAALTSSPKGSKPGQS